MRVRGVARGGGRGVWEVNQQIRRRERRARPQRKIKNAKMNQRSHECMDTAGSYKIKDEEQVVVGGVSS